VRFRHILVHGYSSIDHEVVWAVLQSKVPIVRQEAEMLLDELRAKDAE
jgi:uncharacterized protein with HEPN domain